jgi:3-oxoacyl-[acyl-carrier protein] reductase
MCRTLDHKTAIITGAAKGIGRGMARVFASEGANVIVVDMDDAGGSSAAEELGSTGAHAVFVQADITEKSSCEGAVAAAVDHFGQVDILCSNAGIYPSSRLEEISEEQWDRIFAVNVKGMLFMVQAVLPGMRERGKGSIVLTSSITGPVTGFPGWSHYGATKAAMLGFMHSAAIELAEHAITINAVLPGNVMSPGLHEMGEDYLRIMKESVPLGRLAEPEDIAHAALFLASDDARYITGQTLIVDGGQVLPESILALR